MPGAGDVSDVTVSMDLFPGPQCTNSYDPTVPAEVRYRACAPTPRRRDSFPRLESAAAGVVAGAAAACASTAVVLLLQQDGAPQTSACAAGGGGQRAGHAVWRL